MWQNSGLNIGTVNSSSDSLLKLDTRARTMAKLCQEKDSIYGQDSVLRYVNTPNVARDMISILDAWDEWRDGLQKEKAPCRKTAKSPVAEEETAISGTKGQLVYWGFSYGVSSSLSSHILGTDRCLDSSWSYICSNVSGACWPSGSW